MRSAHLIYNPLAGRFPAGPFLDRAVKVMETAGWSVQVGECYPGRDLADLAREAVAAKADAVFVAGGDGSVGPVAGVLAPMSLPRSSACRAWTGRTGSQSKTPPPNWRAAGSA
jgi:diacylglycerol kinase family enzyme